MTKRVKHIELLEKILKRMELSVSTFYDKDETYECADIILTSIQKAGVGFDDEKTCRNHDGRPINVLFIILDAVNVSQTIGRAFRSNYPFIIELCDDADILRGKRHAGLRDKYYEGEGGEIYQINQEDLDVENIENCCD